MNNFSGKPTASQLRDYKKRSPAYFNELVQKYKTEDPEYYEKVVKYVEGGVTVNPSSARVMAIVAALAIMVLVAGIVFFIMLARE